MASSFEVHWMAAKFVVRYLREKTSTGIVIANLGACRGPMATTMSLSHLAATVTGKAKSRLRSLLGNE